MKKFNYIKTFEDFKEVELDAKLKEDAPTRTKPGTKPKRRQKPTPIRRDKPGVKPAPKAEGLKKANEQDIIDRFASLTDQK